MAQPPRTPITDQTQVPNDGCEYETHKMPLGTKIGNGPDLTPKQVFRVPRIEGQSAMDVGLRAMDYLLSHSSLQQLQAREASGNG